MGRVVVLAHQNATENGNDKTPCHVISWKSGIIHRVCRSTMQAETQACQKGVENTTHLRAAIADTRNKLAKGFDWEISAKRAMKHIWLTDCESLHSYINNPVAAGCEDKRQETDLEALRQFVWDDDDEQPLDEIDPDHPDAIRWIDTSTMIADPLTKRMEAERLLSCMDTNILDLEPTHESTMVKMAKQAQRKKKAAEKENEEVNSNS